MTHLSKELLNSFVDRLVSGEYKHNPIAIQLAKHSPSLFMELVDSVDAANLHSTNSLSSCSSILQEIVVQIKGREHIHAIKLIRQYCGFGLKSAKDVADNVRSFMIALGVMTVDHIVHRPIPLDNIEEKQMFDTLVKTVNFLYPGK